MIQKFGKDAYLSLIRQFNKQVTLSIIRHGETDHNLKGYVHGARTDCHLNANGKQQANNIANRLKEEILNPVPSNPSLDDYRAPPINLIISSPLVRALETANTIKNKIEVCNKEIPLISTPLLKERDFGVYEDATYTKILNDLMSNGKKWEDLLHPRIVHASDILSNVASNKMESSVEMHHRVQQAIQFIFDKTIIEMSKHEDLKKFHVCVVSHGITIRMLLGNLLLGQGKIMSCALGNTSLCRLLLEIHEEKEMFYNPYLLVLNDTSHNDANNLSIKQIDAI